MDLFRRLHQSTYPSRPSPLSGSQESRDDRVRQPSGLPAAHDSLRHADSEKLRPAGRYEYSAAPTTSHLYSPGLSREVQGVRGENAGAAISPPRSQHAHQHRRNASLETRQLAHGHRRNLSQPQGAHLQEGPQEHSAPPAFGNRQMPPPSPPQPYGVRSQSTTAPASSLLSRDALNAPSHRPGSSMSISAMLGSDSERPARESGTSLFSRPPGSSMFGSAPSSASVAMSPPTGPSRPSPLDQSSFRRSHTPEKSYSGGQMGRPYRSGSGGGSSLVGGVEQAKFGGLSRPPLSQYPDKPHSTHPSPQISTAEQPYEARRMSFSGPIARPSSQPPNADALARPPGYSPLSRPSAGATDRYEPGQRASSSSYTPLDSHGRNPSGRLGSIFGDRRSEEDALRERERERERDRGIHATDPKASLAAATRFGSLYSEREPLDRHSTTSTWDHGRSHPSSPESKRFPAPDAGSGFGFGAIQSYTKSLGSQPGGGRQPPLSLQTSHGRVSPTQRESPYLNKSQPQPARLGSTPLTASSTTAPSLGLSTVDEQGRRKGSDELFHHRNLLGVGSDGKRGGRASPLPQAVQGAQAPFIGSSGEPGIKNELGRVFSGIGSGVGGVTAGSSGSGPSTPLISSPFKRDSLTGRSINGDAEDAKVTRPISATGQSRSRKSRDEDVPMEEGSASTSNRGRRSRHVHHHHHHHHHHRHKTDDETSTLGSLHRPTQANLLGRTSTPAEAPAGHHHHHHHHHHHAPRPTATVPASPIRDPRTTVNLEGILSSVAHLPRHHLGSTLYNPRIGVPGARASPESSKFGYTTTPQPLPRFEQRENCTFTVRVPRFRIDAARREEICARRALWGTGVYTDDSDPVAAAIHSGYIRGAWGEDVDESMLDLEIKDTYQHAPPPTTEQGDRKPRLPPVPPADKDLHITLLVLPRLDQYESTVMFGLKSRKWTGRHDGMSFKVHRVEWVDEGVGRGEERSGEARRKRLRTLMQTGRICTGPAMARMDELRRRGVQVPRSLEEQEQSTPVQPVS